MDKQRLLSVDDLITWCATRVIEVQTLMIKIKVFFAAVDFIASVSRIYGPDGS